MTSPFSAVLSGREPSFTLAENEHFIAALERSPLAKGHVVVIAKQEVDDLFDLPEAALASLLLFSKRIRDSLKQVVPSEKVGVAVLGLVARHAHMHLVPLRSAEDLNFTRAKLVVPEAELIELAARIRSLLNA